MSVESKKQDGELLLPTVEAEPGTELILGDETISERKQKEKDFNKSKVCECGDKCAPGTCKCEKS